MPKNLLTAILASVFFSFTTVQAKNDVGSWRKVNLYNEIIGKWEGKTTLTLNIKVDFDKFLTDITDVPIMQIAGIQKDDFWEKVLEGLKEDGDLQSDGIVTITTGKYYMNVFGAAYDILPVNNSIENDTLWLSADGNQLKLSLRKKHCHLTGVTKK